MPSIASGNKIRRINLRTTSVQESLIKGAATRRGISVTDFVLESAWNGATLSTVFRAASNRSIIG